MFARLYVMLIYPNTEKKKRIEKCSSIPFFPPGNHECRCRVHDQGQRVRRRVSLPLIPRCFASPSAHSPSAARLGCSVWYVLAPVVDHGSSTPHSLLVLAAFASLFGFSMDVSSNATLAASLAAATLPDDQSFSFCSRCGYCSIYIRDTNIDIVYIFINSKYMNLYLLDLFLFISRCLQDST